MKIGMFETLPGFGGGNVYQKYVRQALATRHDIQVFPLHPKPVLKTRLGKIWDAGQVYRANPDIELWISTTLATTALAFRRLHGKVLTLFYHQDDRAAPNPALSRLIHRVYLAQAKRCVRVVVGADYWKDYMEDHGISSVEVIYWGFDTTQFKFSPSDIQAFKTQQGLNGKPVIYLGNCHEKKGVVEAYEQLKDLQYHLLTSGERQVDIPALNLNLEYDQYRLLLSASDVVLTLSKFKEGWNATAHEAMLAGTPVIGSGLGGMAELLEGGGQMICKEYNKLPAMVKLALENREQLGQAGKRFAEQFTIERFNQAWLSLVETIEAS